MPIFDYTCADCGQTSELLVRSSRDKPACPHGGCGQPRGGCGN